jgi:hypothetical protein
MAAKESGVARREWGVAVGGGKHGWAGCVALSVLVVPAMSRAATCDDHDVGSIICLQHRFRVYTP